MSDCEDFATPQKLINNKEPQTLLSNRESIEK
jgi:hypothetical protein